MSGRLPLMIGGVMRCCIETLNQADRPADTTPEGTYMQCDWCSSGLVVRDGAWQWAGRAYLDGVTDGT